MVVRRVVAMVKYTFYIGFHDETGENQEIVLRNQEFKDKGIALKLLRALKEIYSYLKEGH